MARRCCNITKWTIKPEHLNRLSNIILHADTEQAGAIVFDDEHLISSNIILNSSGDKDSVHINLDDNHIISFHTHPITAYIQAQCIYGHPSGDDIREFVRLSTSGALNHGVFSVEGFYLVQVHPRMVRYMRNLTEENRGIVLDAIYQYFRIYHGKRMYKNVRYNGYTPRQFVKACNSMKLTDLNLPDGKIDKSRFPKRVISCVWFFTDTVKQNEKDYDKVWNDIQKRSVVISYTKRINPVTFPFLELKQSDRRLKTIMQQVDQCVLSD